ncbi:chemotaxis protein CheX [Halobacteriovorax sp. GB3]|uniref:chemotaxis protein CheX n=1 Tax=Halobacteriovorax sp. GB3 TaxID=2719615 RepID=UPI002362BEF4|nr:chemotaxis protein CheX [Halobacteriovorax sp. GB3]MDD0853904.1 chemotaxis protein CheX [Halobacteriovorax sp. GB3]
MSNSNVVFASTKPEFLGELNDKINGQAQTKIITTAEDLLEEFQGHKIDLLYLEDSFGLDKTKEILNAYLNSEGGKRGYIFLGSENFQEIKPILEEVKVQNLKAIFLPADATKVSSNLLNLITEFENKGKNSYNVDTQFMKHFIDSAVSTFEQWTQGEVKALKPHLLSKTKDKNIGVRGKLVIESSFFNGTFFISFPVDTYKQIYEQMTGIPFEGFNDENCDLASEFVNIVYGGAKTNLNVHNYNLGMLIPTYSRAKTIDSPFDIIVIPLDTKMGPVYLKICPDYLEK